MVYKLYLACLLHQLIIFPTYPIFLSIMILYLDSKAPQPPKCSHKVPGRHLHNIIKIIQASDPELLLFHSYLQKDFIRAKSWAEQWTRVPSMHTFILHKPIRPHAKGVPCRNFTPLFLWCLRDQSPLNQVRSQWDPGGLWPRAYRAAKLLLKGPCTYSASRQEYNYDRKGGKVSYSL